MGALMQIVESSSVILILLFHDSPHGGRWRDNESRVLVPYI